MYLTSHKVVMEIFSSCSDYYCVCVCVQCVLLSQGGAAAMLKNKQKYSEVIHNPLTIPDSRVIRIIRVMLQHLFVEVNVDDGVVHGAAFGQVNRHCAHQWMDLHIRNGDHKHGQAGIRQPADQKCQDHQNHHGCHLHLPFSHRTPFHTGHL